MISFECKKCNSHSFFLRQSNNQKGLYCEDCGAWQKWLSKDEFNAYQNAKESYKNAYLTIKITDHKPSDDEVKGIWSDTYKLFLQYKDSDCALLENEINLACETIGGNYENCELAATLVGAVLRVLIDRSDTYRKLSQKGVNDGKESSK